MSGRLAYLLQLYEQGELDGLVRQELALWRRALDSPPRGKALPVALVPSPLTASVRLRPVLDPALRLDPASLRRRFADLVVRFDPEQPAVAVSAEFLGRFIDLPPLGLIPVSQSGDIVTGWVNFERLGALAEHRAALRIEALRVLAPTGGGGGQSRSRPVALNAAPGGQGVRIACIDMGFDFAHPSVLRDVAGDEQVRALWLHDMVVPPSPAGPVVAQPGRRFSASDLRTSLEWYNDPVETPVGPEAVELHFGRLRNPPGNVLYRTMLQQHGTAVVGIAAGNGRGAGPEAVAGVAPEADLLLVALGSHDEERFADTTQVSAAFDAAFADTSAPCVALMANSDNLGPHDGSLHGERALDDLLLEPGRAIVLTAGNLNHRMGGTADMPAFHALTGSGAGQPQPLVLRYEAGASWPDSAEVWFRTAPNTSASVTISMHVRNYDLGDAPPVVPDQPLVVIFNPAMVPFSHTTVTAQVEWNDDADAFCLRLFFRPNPGESIARSTWTITVPAIGPVHAWLDRNNEGVGHWDGPTAMAGADGMTLGSPSTATRPLVVGSVADATGRPSDFSGRGPVREDHGVANPKPDLVAVGENVSAPLGDPGVRWRHLRPTGSAYATFSRGTSYAAPRVAGACALLFQRFGPSATWADIRQGILQAAMRTAAMPVPDATGWDSACGFGMLDDLTRLPSAPTSVVMARTTLPVPATAPAALPDGADLWLAKTPRDDGTEPFVAPTFWDSPTLVLLDAKGQELAPAAVAAGRANPAQLRVRVGNRGERTAEKAVLEVWWAPLGALYPLPRPGQGGGAWRADGFKVDGVQGNRRRLSSLRPGSTEQLAFDWAPPRDNGGAGVRPHMLLATVDCAEDPFDPTDTLCAQNNAAALSVAVLQPGSPVTLHVPGTNDIDGLRLWHEDWSARLMVRDLPIAALPWRDAAMFQASGRNSRPLHGDLDVADDPAFRYATPLDGAAAIAAITDVKGVQRLTLANGDVTLEGGAQIVLPRLRIAEGMSLALQVGVMSGNGNLHALHLSGGRRVGGCTIRDAALAPAPSSVII